MSISTFTVDAGIIVHITTARGYLPPGVYIPPYCSVIELVKLDISATLSSSDIGKIEHIIKDEFTDLYIVVKDGNRA
jgi:hypothetical protein